VMLWWPGYSLDSLCVGVLGLWPLVVDEESGGDFDFALETGVVELVSEGGCHFVYAFGIDKRWQVRYVYRWKERAWGGMDAD
jgi:hypothetical protein